jgi:ubiquinol oxidase
MHLMTFMTVRQPSVLFRTFVLGAQGVFYNLFCVPSTL